MSHTHLPVIREAAIKFSIGLCVRYQPNAYHNFWHGLSVAQTTCILLQEPQVSFAIDPIGRAALVVAALGHDVDHPGVNNKFLSELKW